MCTATVEAVADDVRATVREIEAEVVKYPGFDEATFLLDGERVLQMRKFGGAWKLGIVSSVPFRADEALEYCEAKELIDCREVLPHYLELVRTRTA